MAGRVWLAYEREAVEKFYGRIPTRDIARCLSRTERSVYQTAEAIGLTTPRRRTFGAVAAVIRRRHPEGWTDSDIAAEAGVSREWITECRRRLGLPANRGSEHYREKVRRNTRKQLERVGLPSLAAVRAGVFRRRALEAGWPADLRPRSVEILNLLWDRGPMTRRQLAEAMGMPADRPSRRLLKSNDPEGAYTAHLLKRGLIVSLGRVGARGKGKGGGVVVYSLPLTIERGEVA